MAAMFLLKFCFNESVYHTPISFSFQKQITRLGYNAFFFSFLKLSFSNEPELVLLSMFEK